jgi:hypothetical protein
MHLQRCLPLEIRLAELHQNNLLRSGCLFQLSILLEHRIHDAGASRRLIFCFKISGELLEAFTYRLHHGGSRRSREPRGLPFYYQCSQIFFFLYPLARREISSHGPFETAGILLDEWEQQV